MDRKDKIKELKRKNAITNLCKIWKEEGIVVTYDDFLDIDETFSIQEIIINKMNELDEADLSNKYTKEENDIVKIYTQSMLNSLKSDTEYCFFVRNPSEYGCVKLKGEILKRNIKFLIKESEFYYNSCSIFCYSRNDEVGICLWSGEYDYRIYVW